jgi:cytidylate kinase
MEKAYHSIAIDGPSGAGKSSVARLLAAELSFLYVDTGAIYRTVGLYIKRCGVDPKDEAKISPLLGEIRIEMSIGPDGMQHMFLNGEDVTQAIRSPDVSLCASDISAHPSVRAFLLNMQRDTARFSNVIMDGRDIGTVVLPDADVKIFLTAAAEKRALRRMLELKACGRDIPFETVLKEINERDKNDSCRAVAPLRMAEDAILVDTTNQTLPEVVAHLKTLIGERITL